MTTNEKNCADALTQQQIEELKQAARAATQGVWNIGKRGTGIITGGPTIGFARGSAQQQLAMFCSHEWMRDDERDANATYCVAARPEIVLALLERLERAEFAIAASPIEQPAAVLRSIPGDKLPGSDDVVHASAWWRDPSHCHVVFGSELETRFTTPQPAQADARMVLKVDQRAAIEFALGACAGHRAGESHVAALESLLAMRPGQPDTEDVNEDAAGAREARS
ncbi:hypothetical protein WI72_11685 [Burkholderia ubonensis]|uniref:hypothetical protein n=1 Tax=Burkholderia ubonensis TaxID=101571 RepID=UPI0007554F01|nr:hypothetical protein [Burkholderia ubonensis]KVC61870.1 hypothetical protein WI72_11685 [Burkholderia ubonensis]